MSEILTSVMSMSAWEAFATVLALLYVVLAAKGNMWCWPAALVSTAIYSIIFFDVSLIMESLLNVYYMAMAIFGWFSWFFAKRKSAQLTHQDTVELPIVSWTVKRHLMGIVILVPIALVLGYWMDSNTHADFAYLDTLTTVFAVYTTYLVAIRVLENWLYWIVINGISIYLYISKELMFLTALMFAYTVLAMWGYYTWSKQHITQKVTQ